MTRVPVLFNFALIPIQLLGRICRFHAPKGWCGEEPGGGGIFHVAVPKKKHFPRDSPEKKQHSAFLIVKRFQPPQEGGGHMNVPIGKTVSELDVPI